MAMMVGGLVERVNTIDENKQVLSELARNNEFVEPSKEKLDTLFDKLNAENAREIVNYMHSYEPDWHNKKVAGRLYGPIPGVPCGSWWGIRMDCSRDRMHDPFSLSVQCGPVGAVSVCTSHSDEDVDLGDILSFTSEASAEKQGYIGRRGYLKNKEENPENRSLILSLENQVPIRIIRSYNLSNEYSPKTGYRYDGLYVVVKCWIGVSLETGLKCYKFALRRLLHQDPPPWKLQAPCDRGVEPGANTNDTIISRCISMKKFQGRDGKMSQLHALCNDNPSKATKSVEKEKQSLSKEERSPVGRAGNSSRPDITTTVTVLPGRNTVSDDHTNVQGSTIVTRRVSKKAPNNKSDSKQLISESSNKPSSEIQPRNELGEEERVKSQGTRLQNTNISIRYDLYDSSHNIKQRGSNVATYSGGGSGGFKPRMHIVPTRQLHFAGVDSSPGSSSRTISSVKMERVESFGGAKKLNLDEICNEKEISSLTHQQNPQLSVEHSYATQLTEGSELHDEKVEQNRQSFVNKAMNEREALLKPRQRERRNKKNSRECESHISSSIEETEVRKTVDALNRIQSTVNDNSSSEETLAGRKLRDVSVPSPSESPPFKGFVSARNIDRKTWPESVEMASSLTVEKMLDIITEEKTSPMAKMLISTVIGFPHVETLPACNNNKESTLTNVHYKELDNSAQRAMYQNKTGVQTAINKRTPLSMRTRSCAKLCEQTAAKTVQEKETVLNVSSERLKMVDKTVLCLERIGSNYPPKLSHSRQFRCLDNSREQNIIEIVYTGKESLGNQQAVDANLNHTHRLRSSGKVEVGGKPKIKNPDIKATEQPHMLGSRAREVRVPSNRNRRWPDAVDANAANYIVTKRKSGSEPCRSDGEVDAYETVPRISENQENNTSSSAKSVDTVDCSKITKDSSIQLKEQIQTNGCLIGARKSSMPNKPEFVERTDDSCLQKSLRSDQTLVTKSTEKSNSERISDDKVSNFRGNLISERLQESKITSQSSEARDITSDSVARNFAGDKNKLSSLKPLGEVTRSKESGLVSRKKDRSPEKIRLAKRPRVRVKHKLEIANLVIDMNMSPRSQISKSRSGRSLRGVDYLRGGRSCPTILDQSRKRRNTEPVQHPTSLPKRMSKNTQIPNSSVRITDAANSMKELKLQKTSEGEKSLSNNNNNNNRNIKNSTSMRRIGRTEKIVTKIKKPMKAKKSNIVTARRAIADMPKMIRKQDLVVKAKKQPSEVASRPTRREAVTRTRSGRSPRSLTIGRLCIRRPLPQSGETYALQTKNQRDKSERVVKQNSNPGKQPLPQREPAKFAQLNCNAEKRSTEVRTKSKMISVMVQCSLIPNPPESPICDLDANNRSKRNSPSDRSVNTGYLISEYIGSSRNSESKRVKHEVIDLIEIKSESGSENVVECQLDDDETDRVENSVLRIKPSKSNRAFAKSDRRESTLDLASLHDQRSKDSLSNRGFVRYVPSRKQSTIVPVKTAELSFRIAQLESIGFKPIKPGIHPNDESEHGRRSTSDSPRILYVSRVVKRGVNEEYDKYTSEETNVVQYMDSELSYEDIENEDKDFYVQKMEFLKFGDDMDEESIHISESHGEEEEEEAELEEENEEEEEDEENVKDDEEQEEDFGRDLKTEWQSQLNEDRNSSNIDDYDQLAADSDGDVPPWHGWRKIISNKETYFVGW